MIDPLLLTLLLVGHFVADFLLQPRWMGTRKSSELGPWALHVAVIFLVVPIPFLVLSGNRWTSEWFFFACANAAAHGAIDATIWNLYKLRWAPAVRSGRVRREDVRYWEDHWFYATIGLDQLQHALTIVGLLWALSLGGN